MTQTSPDTCAALVGIDWADVTHDGCLQTAGSAKRECLQLEPPPEAIDAWGTTLRTRVHGPPVAICLALTQGPLVSALRQDDLLVLCPSQPLTLARSRAAFTPSRATDAPPDAALPLARRLTPRDTLQPRQPQRPPRRALAQLVDHRRRVVGDKVRLTNRLTRALKHSCPHVLHWLQEQDTALFGDFLRRGPPLKAVQLARRATLATFFRAHHVRYADGIAQRLQAITSATPRTTDDGVIAPPVRLVQALGAQLRGTLQALAAFDTAIAPRAPRPPECPLFQALQGAGPGCAPRLLVAFGDQRDR